MTHYRYALTTVALAVCQFAVAQAPQNTEALPGTNVVTESGAASKAATPASASAAKADEAKTTEPRLIRGNDHIVAPARTVPPIEGAPVSFNFEEAPVAEVVRAILGDVLKVNYVLHPPLSGTVTLATRNPMPPDQAVFLLESALQANGLAMMRDARGSYHVGRPDALRNIGGSVRQVGNGPLPPGYGAIVVPLQYIGAAEMATILKPLMPSDAIVRVDSIRNLLVLTGTRTQAEGWLDLINTFDVDLLKGMSIGLFPLKHATIKEVEAALRLVSGAPQASSGGGSSATATVGVPGAASASAGASAAALGENNPLFGALRIMPVERLNAVLVVTPRAAYLEEARRWIEKLDQPSDGGAEPQLFIYRVQNGNARHLAGVLSGIFGTGQQTGGYVANSGVAPGLGTSTGTSFGQQQAFGNTGVQGGGFGGSNYATNSLGSNTFGRAATGVGAFGTQSRTANQSTGTGGVVAANLGGVRVMADEQNNSILVWSTRSDFQKIENTLKRLDLPPTQVLIEASIIEVTLSDDLKYGLKWAFSDTHRGGAGRGVVGALPQDSSGGFSYTLADAVGMRVELNALAAKSLLKVISSPSLMVLDNQTATIAVGNQQPIRASETNNPATTGNNITTTTYQYKDTGVQLSVQPSVNSGDLVTMDISQTVTDVGDGDTVTGQRSFLQRQINSKVAVRSGEAIVLGGLIKDNSSSGRSGVPLLSSLPVVGGLFGATTNNSGRTELLVIITPKVVRTDPEIRGVSEELRDRLKGLSVIDMRDRAAARPAPAAPALQPLTPP